MSLYRRWASLDAPRRRLTIEAAVAIGLVCAGLRLVPFLTLRRLLDRMPMPQAHGLDSLAAVASVNWAVTAVAARVPAATCLVQALAATVLLRRRGLPCELRLGVRSRTAHGGPPIEAHAWVECGGRVAVGAVDHLSELAVMTPPESA